MLVSFVLSYRQEYFIVFDGGSHGPGVELNASIVVVGVLFVLCEKKAKGTIRTTGNIPGNVGTLCLEGGNQRSTGPVDLWA
jgi:hypothetical protein